VTNAEVQRVDMRVDVTRKTKIAGDLETMASVYFAPQHVSESPIVFFGFPGGGYSRGYYDIQWPGHTGYSQAEHHARNGHIFVACDHIGVGDSTVPEDLLGVSYEDVATINHLTTTAVLNRLAEGALTPDLPAVPDAIPLGMGQSMGGFILTLQQALHRSFAGIAILGWSAIETRVPAPPGKPPWPADPSRVTPEMRYEYFRWGFHYDDVPEQMVRADLEDWPLRRSARPFPNWASRTIPGDTTLFMSPNNYVAKYAAAIDVPIFLSMGERDVCPDPHAEPSAYRSATDITFWIQPRAGHMHNFAGTRVQLWDRIEAWADRVRRFRET
jgi:alpha-beta hydrolase superfamily lysophospholipase